ncbi:hypothetical protein [Parageobacillus sp. G301]|uniref:hypothetical protein n=1 Tax=Anoxybacillaceae TaxID=3120669 RepID=UPI00078EAC04|nr:hypothetical protein [Parageobacillus sp. G301]AMV11552.1 hypothetical protein GT3570_11525 [Geobacillus thermoleovorans]GLH62383.1 hypothetical protein PG301_02230 [Parageobacillus sp. G301]
MRLNDKFTIEDMKDFQERLNKLQISATHWDIRSNASETELELLDTIDHLCRVSNMLCVIIEQELKGHIVTAQPHRYTNVKLSIAEASLKNYLKYKNITLA